MPRRGGLIFSAILHLAVLLAVVFGLPQLFERKLPEETPLVVELVNLAPETHATQVTHTPPRPNKPKEVAQADAPKPPPKPEPLKPPPPPAPPPEAAPKPPEPKPEPPKPEPPKPEPPPPPPPPPPEPKPAPPPPPPPKPEPPKPRPPKPAPPKPKQDDTAFDALLKNLAKRDPARTPVDQPPKQVAAAAPQASSQPVAPLGAKLTTSELDLVKQQIEACWNVPAGARDAKDLTPEFRVYMNQDGTIRSATQLNPERNSDEFFRAAAESAMRALRNPRCQPLKLPPEKYDQWQTFTITFDPKDIS